MSDSLKSVNDISVKVYSLDEKKVEKDSNVVRCPKCGFTLEFADWRFISALHGTGVGHLLESADKAFEAAMMDLKTSVLSAVLEQAVMEHQPPMSKGRRIKLRYAHQGGKNPPLVVIHGNQTDAVPNAYRRYLVNRFRKVFELHGTPLRIEFRSGENPFAGRRNKLTPRQERKRARLMKRVKKK